MWQSSPCADKSCIFKDICAKHTENCKGSTWAPYSTLNREAATVCPHFTAVRPDYEARARDIVYRNIQEGESLVLAIAEALRSAYTAGGVSGIDFVSRVQAAEFSASPEGAHVRDYVTQLSRLCEEVGHAEGHV